MMGFDNDVVLEVSRAYLELREIDKRNNLLRFIEQVSDDGCFVWSRKKEGLNGNRVEMWRVFYEEYSGSEKNGLSSGEIACVLPNYLKSYLIDLRKEISNLE